MHFLYFICFHLNFLAIVTTNVWHMRHMRYMRHSYARYLRILRIRHGLRDLADALNMNASYWEITFVATKELAAASGAAAGAAHAAYAQQTRPA